MSLLTEAMEECVMLDKRTVDDGMGGYTRTWEEGAHFQAAKEGVSSLYTVTISRANMLEYHDVFRRVRDGKIFRVTSDGDDSYTPASAGLDMRQVTAEEWVLA